MDLLRWGIWNILNAFWTSYCNSPEMLPEVHEILSEMNSAVAGNAVKGTGTGCSDTQDRVSVLSPFPSLSSEA